MHRSESLDESILIVDDNAENIQFLARLLDDEGYGVRAATDGHMAVTAVKKNPPDLILMDVMMPAMDGYATLAQIRSLDNGSDIPVIFLTARTSEQDIVRGFEAGAVDYVVKPFHTTELLVRVRTHLALRQKERTIRRILRDRQYVLRMLAHDLAANLSAIDATAMLVGNDSAKAMQFLPFVRRSVLDCMDMIKNAQKLTDIEDTNIDFTLEESSLGEAIDRTLTLLAPDLQSKEIHVRSVLTYTGSVRAESTTLINTVLRNILHNALKFSDRKGTIEILSRAQGDFAEVIIQDYGPGISELAWQSLSVMEKSPSLPGTEGELGTGYGLLLVSRFLEAYGGAMTIDRSAAVGTKVILRFQIP